MVQPLAEPDDARSQWEVVLALLTSLMMRHKSKVRRRTSLTWPPRHRSQAMITVILMTPVLWR